MPSGSAEGFIQRVRALPLPGRLRSVPNIGPVTAAAFIATVDDAQRFRHAHQLEGYLGLVPRESSSGETQRRGPITKAGHSRVRWRLIHAAISILRIAARRGKHVEELVIRELARRLPEYIENLRVEDFVARLHEALRTDIRLGREFLRETPRHVRIADAGHRQRRCPICEQALGYVTPQHLAPHGVTLRDTYRRFPELGFTSGARLTIQPSPEGLLNTGEVFGLVVAGAGFEPATFGL